MRLSGISLATCISLYTFIQIYGAQTPSIHLIKCIANLALHLNILVKYLVIANKFIVIGNIKLMRTVVWYSIGKYFKT